MARIHPVETTQAAPKARTLLEGVQKKLGMTPNLMRTMANSPAVLESYLGFSGSLAQSEISAKLREQIALTVGESNRCQYCLSAHSALAKMAGLGEEEIADSRRGVSPDRKTEAVLEFARKIVRERGFVSDGDVAAVRAAGVNEAELVEIVAAVALNIFTNYFNHVAETDIDFPEVEPAHGPTCAC
ncbi:MAG TPA: carboxymuconolactone decarboxylase family protein [Phycisphaerae bacterium]|nr:carboxymuconolactone decarboxylase family protein [Phycisphaerae bacterium]HRW52345.1 carboxymuconolactone decarboxylase family protein [Phycisphaerae bacterium]